MKKNKMMRFASMLLVAVLITTCAISGTFAKYVTGGTATDSARVAAFGVKVQTTSDLFATEYTTSEDDTTITVKSSTDMNVVAPGTSGSITKAAITGTPEVAVKVAISGAAVTVNDKWTDNDGNFYFPLTIKVGGEAVDLSSAASASDVQTAIAAALNAAATDVIEPGTDLSGTSITALDVEWEWAFESGDDADAIAAVDAQDTALGDAAAAALAEDDTEADAPSIAIAYDITVTQID